MFEDFLTYIRVERGLSPNTVEAYGRDLRQWADFATGGSPDDLRPDDVAASDLRVWVAALGRCGVSARSIRRKIQSLRAFYAYMMKIHGLASNPAADLELARLDRPLPVYVKPEETERLLSEDSAPEPDDDFTRARDTLLLETLYSTGIRCSELIGLKESGVDAARRELKVLGKRNKERVIPFGDRLAGLIADYRAQKLERGLEGTTDFFVRASGEPLYRMMVWRIVHQRMEEAGVHATRLSPHVLRHSFATDMLNDGADINAVQQLLGHASLATTQVYTHVTFSDLKNNYNRAHPRALNH